MTDPTSIELTVLGIGVVLTVAVGQILARSGRLFLQDSFERPETASSVSTLLLVLFHLVVLGVIALVATIDLSIENAVEAIVVRLGFVLLVLGAAHAGTLLALTWLRRRRREQMLLGEMSAQTRQARRAQRRMRSAGGGTEPQAAASPDRADSADTRAAIERSEPGGQQH